MSTTARRSIVSLVWTAVGLLLIWRGLPYAGLRAAPEVKGLAGAETWAALAIAVVIGIGKGMSALRKAARRAATRIERQGEAAPWGKVFSPVMFLLVAIMVAAGLGLRHAPYDAGVKAWVIGILYPAVGLALLIGGWIVRRAEPVPVEA